MVSKAPHPHAARLEQILTACKVPSQAAFMAWVGEKPQTWRNWSMRGVPDAKARRVRDKTGVDDDWLLSGKGTAFPNGPNLYTAPAADERVAALEAHVDALSGALAQIVRIVSERLPGAGAELATALRAQAGIGQSLLPETEVLVAAAEAGQRSAAPADRAAGQSGSGGKPPRKGR